MYLNDAVQEKGFQSFSFILFLAIPWNKSFGSLLWLGMFLACGIWVTQRGKKKKTVDLEGYVVCLKKLSPFSSFVNLGEKLVLVESGFLLAIVVRI